jgi:hypothetical protein
MLKGRVYGCGGGRGDSAELANKATWASILQEALSATDLGKQTGTAAGDRRGHKWGRDCGASRLRKEDNVRVHRIEED